MSGPRRIHPRHGVLWIIGAVLLAIVSGMLILWWVRPPLAPTMAVVSPVTYNLGSESYRPGNSRKYVVLEVEVKNPTAQAFNFAPVVQTYLTDAAGKRYDMAPSELGNPIAAGLISPGETKRGQLSYNVPNAVRGLTFHFVTDDQYRINFSQAL